MRELTGLEVEVAAEIDHFVQEGTPTGTMCAHGFVAKVVGGNRLAVGAEGPVGQDAADPIGRQLLSRGIPQRGVDEEAVNEHGDRRVGGARPDDPVVDRTDGKIDGGHGASGSIQTSIQGV